MIKDQPQFRIRLPAELKARVEAAAEKEGRSLNAEIVRRLDRSFMMDRPGHHLWVDETTSAMSLEEVPKVLQSLDEAEAHLRSIARAINEIVTTMDEQKSKTR